jgi:uncharacterized protein
VIGIVKMIGAETQTDWSAVMATAVLALLPPVLVKYMALECTFDYVLRSGSMSEWIMSAKPKDDPVLIRFRQALNEMYGDRIERVVLFGSRARGDAREDSDYDVAVFLKSLPDRWAELDRLASLRVDMIDETGVFFDAKPYSADAWFERTPLMHEIRHDGLDL